MRKEEFPEIAQVPIDIPESWRKLPIDELKGMVMIIGEPDVGKTTLAAYLYQMFLDSNLKTAFLDGDPGQSSLGPPTTMTLVMHSRACNSNDTPKLIKRYFVGANSPTRHMLPVLTGAARLIEFSLQFGSEVIIYDTCGLIDPISGGLALKNAKIDLLHPGIIIAIQRGNELQPLIVPHRQSGREKIFEIKPSKLVHGRSPASRRLYRQKKFAAYFEASQERTFNWSEIAIFPAPIFRVQRLVALEDDEGFTLGLGIVTRIDRERKRVCVLTPFKSNKKVNALRLGDLIVDPLTYYHQQI
jgi:polynucleotide 5'-hydroxyl-kinase GRC3/NOL9